MDLKHLTVNPYKMLSARMIVGLSGLILLAVQYSCVEKSPASNEMNVSPAFYHWKTNFSPTKFELDILERHKVQTVYTRFFDVAWDATYQKPSPIAQVRISDKNLLKREHINVVPTVFITNECIQFIKPDQCKDLAEKISGLINEIVRLNSIDPVSEVQIDCDWTASTKEKYFTILSELQKIDTQHLFSATIRLFQVKYMTEAGIPPVKKGLLMCYNMGSLKAVETKNSILDPSEVKKYIGNLNRYPLQLDVALPLFDWYVLFRQGGYLGLVQNLAANKFKTVLQPAGKNHFQVIKDTLLGSSNLKQGDLFRHEESRYEDLMKTASLLKQKLANRRPRLVLYHLDSIILKKYSTHEIETIFNSFH